MVAEGYLPKILGQHPITKFSIRTERAPSATQKIDKLTKSQTRCLFKKSPKTTYKKYKTNTESFNSQETQDTPQLLRKRPAQNIKQNHTPLNKKVSEGHLRVQDKYPIIQLPRSTRHAPAAPQETDTEHKAHPYAE